MKARVEQRGDRYLVVVDAGKDPETGRRKRHVYTLPAGSTKRAAEALCAEKNVELNKKTYVAPSKQTVEEYLAEWLAGKMRISSKTRQEYEAWIRARIVPALGAVPLQDLTARQIQAAWKRLETGGRADGKAGEGLAAKSIHNVHGILRASLTRAVREGLLPRNPCDTVELPRVHKQEMRVLDAAQFTTLLEASRGRRCFAAVLLAGTVGLRRGETLALRWEDMDLERRVLSVAQATEQTRAGVKFKKPKSGKARKVNLPQFVVDELRRYRVESGRVAGLVVCEPDGSVCSPTAITQEFGKLIRSVDLPTIRFHDLRHSAATTLLAHGVPLVVVSEILGHADAGITARVYAHVLEPSRQEAAAKMDEALRMAQG